MYGQVKPSRAKQRINIEVELDKKWQPTSLSAVTNSIGTWKIEVTATAPIGSARYRANATILNSKLYSPAAAIKIKRTPEMINYDPAR
ncbi:MAG: hypothetical protein WDO06_03445 [Actinomycetota bacterium]